MYMGLSMACERALDSNCNFVVFVSVLPFMISPMYLVSLISLFENVKDSFSYNL